MLTCGVDIGSRTVKLVLFDGKKIVDSLVSLSGRAPQSQALELYQELLANHQLNQSDIAMTLATGYGRNYFELADRASSEIICHSAGVVHYFPNIHAIIDIGGQDSKVIQLGENGRVVGFVMNDRCAAGTGKFIEMVAQTLEFSVEQIALLALDGNGACEISSMCAVFAESEIISKLHDSTPVDVILRGVFRSVANRVVALGNKLSLTGPIAFTGGVAQNAGVIEAIKHRLNSETLFVPPKPQITGALGAAILAYRSAS
ncbi:acyl-CoA dehydratase activase [Shewanella benthica]|nr:acyl-CoA dehydratase activase [Shewanella benthica]